MNASGTEMSRISMDLRVQKSIKGKEKRKLKFVWKEQMWEPRL